MSDSSAVNVEAAVHLEAAPIANAQRRFRRLWDRLDRFKPALIASRFWLLAGIHLVLLTVAYLSAFLIRFDFKIPASWLKVFLQTAPWVVLLQLAAFSITGQLHGWWRLVTFRDVVFLGRVFLISLFLIATWNVFYITAAAPIPRSILVLNAMLGFILVGGLRSTSRLFHECVRPTFKPGDYKPAVLIGTDNETVLLAQQMQSYGRMPFRIRGLISIDSDHGRCGNGSLPVLGGLDDLAWIATRFGVSDVLVTAGLLPGRCMRHLMDTCQSEGLELRIVPSFEDRMNGNRLIPTREINIEDLLRREPADLDVEAIRHLLEGQRILVTGAGGSIGSEICRQLTRFSPESLILLGRGENRIFQIEQELSGLNSQTRFEPVIADIRDESRMRQVFAQYRPQIVFHAAAHKHVPLMEHNVSEAINNNVQGTKVLVDIAHHAAVESFVLISTDKAVHPTSVMGATKALAERYVQARSADSPTRFMVVRFGNVLGSAGSVVPVFKSQISSGGPITITDSRMTRYFMTIPEASQLVLQAAAMGRGGELFVLDMGPPIRIVDLARDMIRLSGLPEDAIEVTYTGCRPGEKLYEELADDPDRILETSHPKIRSIFSSPLPAIELASHISHLLALGNQAGEELREALLAMIERCSEQELSAIPKVVDLAASPTRVLEEKTLA